MNIYKILNDITLYIDDHIEEEIDYNILSKMMGVNNYTMQKIFSVLTNVSLSEYIRKRKLSNAMVDLINTNMRIIDISLKYGYDNPTSFSRAFVKLYHIKPSIMRKNKERELIEYPRLIFDEKMNYQENISYEIVVMSKLELYGIGISTTNLEIKKDAPKLFCYISKKYSNYTIKYGMTTYSDKDREKVSKYYVLFDCKLKHLEYIELPESKWLKFRIDSQNPSDIQNKVDTFYRNFLPSCKYNLREIPELEYYHDNVTDFLIPIE